jgi:hypothetical protein
MTEKRTELKVYVPKSKGKTNKRNNLIPVQSEICALLKVSSDNVI